MLLRLRLDFVTTPTGQALDRAHGAPPSVLILCYQFPPVNGTGARRPYYLARTLADEGHKVSILTTEIAEAQPWLPDTLGIAVHRTPKTTVQRDMAAWQRWLARLYWSHQGKPGHGSVRIAADLLLPEGHIDRWDILPDEVERHVGRHDIILATCPSWYPFRLAAKLSERWGAMFVADYRDPWTVQVPTLHLKGFTQFGTGLAGYLRERKMRLAERKWPGSAFALTAISGPLLDNARLTTGVKRGAVVMGGFAPDAERHTKTRNAQFTLVYTGRVYTQQDWGMVLRVVQRMHRADPRLAEQLRIRLYGAVSDDAGLLHQLRSVARATGVVELLPRIGRSDTMRVQQTADALLHISLDHHQGSLPVKFLEYLGAGRPIVLCIKEHDLEQEALESTRTGVVVPDERRFEELLSAQLALWRAGQQWSIQPDREKLKEYDYACQMARWSGMLRGWHKDFMGSKAT